MLSRQLILWSAAGLLVVGCASPKPPNRPPDFAGTVIGRTPRLPNGDAAHLVIGAQTSRVDVTLGAGVQVLEALPEGGYRWAESNDAWVGRAVQVWYAANDSTPVAPISAGVVPHHASYVVAARR
jgi:hypothetical protein